ncbi:hypothetical protein ABZ379_40830 [Streptomyces canus]|uniref:hypothetical protein n=1 Tax=Streptomyces canus TaxID=58343 RepID=UPI003402E460
MQTTTSTRETTSPTLRRDSGTARHSAVIATLSALLLLAASVAGQIAAGADYPAVPPGLVIPLVVAGLLAWRTNGWTTGLALGVGLSIGVGALLTPVLVLPALAWLLSHTPWSEPLRRRLLYAAIGSYGAAVIGAAVWASLTY